MLKSIQCSKGKCKQELMLNPHTPSELLEEKLCYAGLTDMPHPGKLCWWGALPMDGASTDNCHCDYYSRSLYIQL